MLTSRPTKKNGLIAV